MLDATEVSLLLSYPRDRTVECIHAHAGAHPGARTGRLAGGWVSVHLHTDILIGSFSYAPHNPAQQCSF